MGKVILITSGRVLFSGTMKECRAYKRNHYDRFSKVYAV